MVFSAVKQVPALRTVHQSAQVTLWTGHAIHVLLAEIIQSAWIGLIVKPTPLHELCVDTDRSHDGVVEGFIEQTRHFLVLQVFLREADNYGCFRNDGTVQSRCLLGGRQMGTNITTIVMQIVKRQVSWSSDQQSGLMPFLMRSP